MVTLGARVIGNVPSYPGVGRIFLTLRIAQLYMRGLITSFAVSMIEFIKSNIN